jgi:ABC-2 type transport system ATP-binding protein
VIELAGVSRRFGRVQALRDVGFQVGRGEIVGFLGPNGAGKTTTLRILAGFLAPDAGQVRVDGIDVRARPIAARARLGLLAENAPSYPEMRVRDYLAFRAVLKDIPGRERGARVDEAIVRCALAEVASRPCGQLSRGFRQRLGLADAILARPPVLLLDEPTSGLDPNQVREFRELVRSMTAEHTVLFSSHVLPEVETIAPRVVVLAAGRVVADGTPAELRARHAPGGGSLEDAFAALTNAPAATATAELPR